MLTVSFLLHTKVRKSEQYGSNGELVIKRQLCHTEVFKVRVLFDQISKATRLNATVCFERPNHCSAIALPAFSSFHRVFARRPIFHRLTSVACPMFEWLLRREMRQARGQFASYHSITLPHYHCSTVSRYHSSTVPLYHSTTEALYHRTTVSFTTVSL